MEADGLDFKERLVIERKAPPPLKALAGEGEPGGAPGAAWAHMRQRLARAEREARSARRLSIALFGASMAGMAGILRVALPWSAARTAELAAHGARMGAAPAWAGTARDPRLACAVPSSASPAAGRMPSRGSDSAHAPVLPSGGQSLGASLLVAGTPTALVPAPSALPVAKPAGAAPGAHPVSHPVPGNQPVASRPQPASSHGISGSRSASSHIPDHAPQSAVHRLPSAVHGLPSTASRPPSPVQPRRIRRTVRLTSYRAPATPWRSRWSPRSRAHSRRWRVLRVSTRHGAAYCLVDPHGHWWVARRVYSRGYPRAGSGR